MSDVVQQTQEEFWRPPSPLSTEVVEPAELIPAMAETCARCGTEFLLGSRFCHTCGGRRPEAVSTRARADAAVIAGVWEQLVSQVHRILLGLGRIKFPGWLQYLQFHEIKSRVGLSTASLIAFLLGLVCIAGAVLVGFFTAKTLVEWQAIQFYRAEWLLGATASFVAGILLKKPIDHDSE